jgi:hypothetical protein
MTQESISEALSERARSTKIKGRQQKRAGSVDGHGTEEVARGIPQKNRVSDPEILSRCTEV